MGTNSSPAYRAHARQGHIVLPDRYVAIDRQKIYRRQRLLIPHFFPYRRGKKSRQH